MFGWCDEDGGSKIFWFEETKAGYQKLVRPDGTSRIIKEKNDYFEEQGQHSLAGWRRARLLMKEYEYWDVTAFGIAMNTIAGIRTDRTDEKGDPIVYIFASCEKAERAVYPFLTERQVQICRSNVDNFYKTPNLQAAWHDFILHPVCLRLIKNSRKMEPVSIESLGCGQGVMGRYHFEPIGSLDNWEWIEELFKDYPRDWD